MSSYPTKKGCNINIRKELEKVIPKKDWNAFEEDAAEDLIQIDLSRIAGLGVTPLQLDEWLLLFRNG